jgi:hypothetical protein
MENEIRMRRVRQAGEVLASQMTVLESRLVLSTVFKFPANLIGQIANQSGNLVMTNRAYEQAQRIVDKAIKNFAGSMAKIQSKYGPDYLMNEQAIAEIGLGGGGTYGSKTLLGRLNYEMERAEAKFPYGRGVATDPVIGGVIGTGLSIRSAATGQNVNPASEDPDFESASGTSVAELIDQGLQNIVGGTATRNVAGIIEAVRVNTLQFREPGGLLPNYLASFGPAGSRSFSLINR